MLYNELRQHLAQVAPLIENAYNVLAAAAEQEASAPLAERDGLAMVDVVDELHAVRSKHERPFNSAHEGFAVLLEEVHELQVEVFKGGRELRSVERMHKEATQVAAVAVRFIVDVCK